MMRAELSDIAATVWEGVTCGGLDVNNGSAATCKGEIGYPPMKPISTAMYKVAGNTWIFIYVQRSARIELGLHPHGNTSLN
jgi:hypothetical protein